jgi:hypothetical protein
VTDRHTDTDTHTHTHTHTHTSEVRAQVILFASAYWTSTLLLSSSACTYERRACIITLLLGSKALFRLYCGSIEALLRLY